MTTTELTSHGIANGSSGIEAAIDAGIAIAEQQPVSQEHPDVVSVLIPAGATHKMVDLRKVAPELQARPPRKTGTVHVQNGESFIEYLAKHALPETEVWADANAFAVVAVINAHEDAADRTAVPNAEVADLGAGWGDHRCSLELLKTPAWKTWEALDRKWMTQTQFAEHIEDNSADIVDPDPATMLEIAESFNASGGTNFKSVERLSSGEVKFNYEETVTARAGQTGDIEVPTRFAIEVAPFIGGDTSVVQARFRYRLRSGELSLSYHLVRPHEVLEAAFTAHTEAIEAGVEAPVYAGRPE